MKIRIGTQLALIVAVPILSLVVAVAIVVACFASLEDAKRALSDRAAFQNIGRDIVLHIERSRLYAVRGILIQNSSTDVASRMKEFTAIQDDLNAMTAGAASVSKATADLAATKDAMTALVANAQAASQLMLSDHATYLAAYLGSRDGKYAKAHALIATSVKSQNAVEAGVQALLDDADAARLAASATFDAEVKSVTLVMIVLGLIALLGTIATASLQGRRMSRRLNRVSAALTDIVREDFARLSHALTRLAKGDLRSTFTSQRVAIADRGTDEIGDLVRSYDALASGLNAVGNELSDAMSTLRELVGGVANASRSVSIASEQTSSAANQASAAVEQIAKAVDGVAGGAKDQAFKIAHASAAIEELARAAEQIAQGATAQAEAIQQATGGIQKLDEGIETLSAHGNDLAHSAREASHEAGGGNEAVSQTQQAMLHLREVSQGAAAAMVALEERSAQVEEIVSTIEEIADQTNLLALNAAIEAARAGEHGRGFAVVADEVRKLAERSSQATREIGAILSAIRRETVTAAEAMRSSEASMAGGLSVAERAAAALAGVERAIETTTAVAEDLATRAGAMREASYQVTGNVSSASAGVEENAAAATQMQLTTRDVTATILPVAAAAEEQSAAAQQAALATNELAAGVQEIDATARALREQAELLDGLVARFIVEGEETAHAALRAPSSNRIALAR
ncbi:MAG TPA: HAMP domain-containing methyl-accepting chemotaxis protein [Candidatus Limnocylindria bacterium]|jgi:methyl-accepting chemotaxis protein|nr:HAMP domain-containing methyl-accepting chemotaxis protein [Candidatus Limnocylindria bacterium]